MDMENEKICVLIAGTGGYVGQLDRMKDESKS